MTCKEQNFELIGRIEAFDLDTLSPTVNLYIPQRTLAASPLTSEASPTVVPLYPKSARVSEAAGQGRGGNGYEVSLTWQVQRPSQADIAVLEGMKWNAKHLKITAFGDAVAYIPTEKEHYQFDYQQEGAVVNCTLKVCNINGLQPLLDSN